MPTAYIIMIQGALQTQPGFSTDQLVPNVPVILNNANNTGVTTWLWQFTDLPQGSNAMISNPTQANAGFTPDIPGTYLIRLNINGGVQWNQVGGAVKTLNLQYRIPAITEETEFDNFNTNQKGWGPAINKALQIIDDGYGDILNETLNIQNMSFAVRYAIAACNKTGNNVSGQNLWHERANLAATSGVLLGLSPLIIGTSTQDDANTRANLIKSIVLVHMSDGFSAGSSAPYTYQAAHIVPDDTNGALLAAVPPATFSLPCITLINALYTSIRAHGNATNSLTGGGTHFFDDTSSTGTGFTYISGGANPPVTLTDQLYDLNDLTSGWAYHMLSSSDLYMFGDST